MLEKLKMLHGKGNLTAQNTRKPFGGRGSAPDPAGGAYSAPANPYLVERGWLPPPQEPYPPLSALRASPFLPHSKISSNAIRIPHNPYNMPLSRIPLKNSRILIRINTKV